MEGAALFFSSAEFWLLFTRPERHSPVCSCLVWILSNPAYDADTAEVAMHLLVPELHLEKKAGHDSISLYPSVGEVGLDFPRFTS